MSFVHSAGNSKPALSVVIPTLNRADLLRETLSRVLVNYPIDNPDLEVLVVDNASDFPVADSLSDLLPHFNGNLKCIRFEQRLESTESFARAISCSNGFYIQLFGDDDFPCNYIGHKLLDIISSRSPGTIYINRLIGDSDLQSAGEVAHPQDVSKGLFELSFSEFISKYTHWPSFITCTIFKRKAWDIGLACSQKNYSGFNYYDYICRGCFSGSVIVIGEPLIIQRRGKQTWKKYWPEYWYLGMGNLLVNLDFDGISSNSFSTWMSKEIKIANFVVDLFIAKSFSTIYGKSFWRCLNQLFCDSPLFRILAFLISLLPPSFCLFVLKFSPNRSKYDLP